MLYRYLHINQTLKTLNYFLKKDKDSIIGLILSGRYQVVKKIGSGAFGLVYLVNDIKIDIK